MQKADLKKGNANTLIDRVIDTYSRWQYSAQKTEIDQYKIAGIGKRLVIRL